MAVHPAVVKRFFVRTVLVQSIAMVGLAALVASKLLGFTSTHASATSSHAPMATSVASIRTAAATSAPSQAEADALVHAWFTAKAEATGPGYKVAALPGVLGSAQLRKWSDVVTQLRKDGRCVCCRLLLHNDVQIWPVV